MRSSTRFAALFQTARRRLTAPANKDSHPYEDLALAWARRNPLQAQQCLEIPVDTQQLPLQLHGHTTRLESFSDYWAHRRWNFPTTLAEEKLPLAQALATHVLSAPLTMARQLSSSSSDVMTKTTQQWCCIGARAEASLPTDYWREMLIGLDWCGVTNLSIQLDFVGPEIGSVNRPPVVLDYKLSRLELRWNFAGKLHEMDSSDVSSYDAYILLNPGLGHTHLLDDWKPTLELLLECPGSKLLTAHSELDANRDMELLSRYCSGTCIKYELNIFASRIKYQDPFDPTHIVQPNHYVALLDGTTF